MMFNTSACLAGQIDRGTPNEEQAEAIAMCSVRLPYVFNRNIYKTIEAIEEMMVPKSIKQTWSESYLLKGNLVVIHDENLEAEIYGQTLHYDEFMGLTF